MHGAQLSARARVVAWFHGLPSLVQAITAVVVVVTVTAMLSVGGLLAYFAWDDHQFKSGQYCDAEPTDPLC